MANINNIKIGGITPDAVFFNAPHVYTRDSLLTYAICAVDNKGIEYKVHGLWIAPVSPQGVYSWPWDLGITSGACKDINDGASRWGYVQDTINKELNKAAFNTNFPANVDGNYHVAISIWSANFNYTDGEGRQCTDLDVPIIIKFHDGRFDNYNWVLQPGAVAEWSEDKRTLTIHRVPSSHIVFQSNNEDKTIEKVRKDIYNILVDVEGLDYNFKDLKEIYPESVECWDVKSGDTTLYHKDKTFENCWLKYRIAGEETVTNNNLWHVDGDILCKLYSRNIGNTFADYNSVIIPNIIDLNNYMYKVDVDKKEIHALSFNNCNPKNKEFWNPIKEWFANNIINYWCPRMFNSSNLNEINITIDSLGETDGDYSKNYTHLKDIFNGSKLQKITLNLPHHQIGSGNKLFRGCDWLKEFDITELNGAKSIRAYDYSGMFEFCGCLESIPDNLFNWEVRNYNANIGIASTNLGYTFEGCGKLEEIPVSIYANGDRYSDKNTCIPYFLDQAFNECSNLKLIGPVLDLKIIEPATLKLPFNNCVNLTDMRIKNLNHGDWHFDNTPNEGNYYHGYLPKLNKASIRYLFDNLTDLTTYDSSVITNNTSYNFLQWGTDERESLIIERDYVEFKSGYKDYMWTMEALDNVEVTVEGLTEGSILRFGDMEITSNGDYVLNNTKNNKKRFVFTDTGNPKVRLKTYFKAESPIVSSAKLYCPVEWDDKIFSNMITEANAKGWTIYIGGTEITPADAPEEQP